MRKIAVDKKTILVNVPYVLVGLYATHFGEAYRMAQEAGATDMFDEMLETLPICLTHVMPSVHPVDLLVGAVAGAALKGAVYLKGKNAKKYRHGKEFGSARWGKPKDIEPYMAPKFEDNVILTKTERLMMSNRPKRAKYARNKNVLVLGGNALIRIGRL